MISRLDARVKVRLLPFDNAQVDSFEPCYVAWAYLLLP